MINIICNVKMAFEDSGTVLYFSWWESGHRGSLHEWSFRMKFMRQVLDFICHFTAVIVILLP